MCILVAVNKQTSVTIKQLQEQLNVDKRVLDWNLTALCQGDKKKRWLELLMLDKTTKTITVNSGFRSKIKKCSFMPEAPAPESFIFFRNTWEWRVRSAVLHVMKAEKTCSF